MAEERLVDDEYGRGVKLRKTEEGYVDVTDEQTDTQTDEEELTFAFPALDEEDDEDLVGLTPEEAMELKKQKAEAVARRRAEYDQLVAEGNALLDTNSFHAAELKFEKALALDEPATAASVGYWRAKTENFAKPDNLMDEYVDAGVESLEYDLGYEAVEEMKKDYQAVFAAKLAELKAEEEPLSLDVAEKQSRRREILKARRKRSALAFALSALPLLVCVALAVTFGLKNFSTPDNRYIPLTITFAVLSVVLFFVFAVFSNKLINACRMCAANEKLSSTEQGERLERLLHYIELYEAFVTE